MKNIFKIIMVIMGTFIGAGFSSGREISSFFIRYGINGILGIFLSSIIIGVIIYITFKIVKEKDIENYNYFLENINPKNKLINKIIKIIVNIFLLISFFIMVAGFSAYVKENYNIHTYISAIIFVIIIFFTLTQDVNGILKINSLLVPIILILIFYLGINNIPNINNLNLLEIENGNWFISSVLYTSYNSIVLIPVLVALKNNIKNKKEIIFISFLSSIIIIILSLSIYFLLINSEINLNEIEMPILKIISNYGDLIKKIYGVVIISAIFTSAISTGYSFLKNISNNNKKYIFYLFLICISSIFISNIGFSNLVIILYPTFGVFGLIQLLLIFKKIK